MLCYSGGGGGGVVKFPRVHGLRERKEEGREVGPYFLLQERLELLAGGLLVWHLGQVRPMRERERNFVIHTRCLLFYTKPPTHNLTQRHTDGQTAREEEERLSESSYR